MAEPSWLVVSVSTAGSSGSRDKSGSLRVMAWRKLRSLGGLYLQQSVCLLPVRSDVVREVRRLAERMSLGGGHARVLRMAFTDDGDEHDVVDQFNAARNEEYDEFLERLQAWRQELADLRARRALLHADVERAEVELDLFRSRLAKIAVRDYFDASGGEAVRAAIEQAAAELVLMEDNLLRADDSELSASFEQGLRVVRPE